MNRVGIFWDYENCAPPTGTPGYVVAERLRTTCGAYGGVTQFRAYLELSVPQPPSSHGHSTSADSNDLSCPSTSPKNLTLRSELQSSGVSLIDCPHNSRKNVADSMLACDLVCFALDNPAVPQIPYANYMPSSPYSIPNTPFSAITPPTPSFSKTTIVLVSGDRDFAYPLAILKARKYDVGLIVPPGGAHPALRAQASWVLNWRDVMEGSSPGLDRRFEAATGIRGLADVAPTEVSPSVPSARRPSFASRRGSVSGSRRGSVSSTPSNPAPPPPPPMIEAAPKAPTSFGQPSALPDFLDAAPSTSTRQPPTQLPEASSSQLPGTSRVSRKAPMRRVAKAGSRPPSRNKSRPVPRSVRPERAEPEVSRVVKLEHPRPQPLIVPVPLTVSPVGSAGPSFAGMSPRIGRPQTPPLFSTNPTSPPPPAAPPALSPAHTPPTKVPTPPTKPPTPPRDATRALHRPPIPHVSTPRPPVPGSQQSTSGSDPERTSPPAPTLAAPPPPPKNSVLQSLLPAAPALCPPNATVNPHRPTLTVPALNIQVSNSTTLTPATPVTPPASPLRSWTRLQPVHDDTDGDADRPSSVNKRLKKGKEKAKEKVEQSLEDIESQTEGSGSQRGTKVRRGSVKLAVQVGLMVKTGEEPSAISGVDSILRSYTERTPGVEKNSQVDGLTHDSPSQMDGSHPTTNQGCEDDDEEEEKFHETFFASFSRSQHVVQTPPTIKLLALEVTQGDKHETVFDGGSDLQQRSRHSTPRPAARTSNSMPILPMMQSLLAGMEEVGRSTPERQVNAREAGTRDTNIDSDGITEQVYSRASSPPSLPSLARRSTGLTTTIDPTKAELCVSPSVESTYGEFRALINVLEHWRRNGADRPLRSLIGVEFSHDVYAQVGATSFKDYIQRAVAAGVVTVGGGSVQGREWISLNRRWQGLGLVMD